MKLTILILVIASSILLCQSQLTFSPNWGKRNVAPTNIGQMMSTGGGIGQNNNCKTSVDSIMLLYRIVQVNIKVNLCN